MGPDGLFERVDVAYGFVKGSILLHAVDLVDLKTVLVEKHVDNFDCDRLSQTMPRVACDKDVLVLRRWDRYLQLPYVAATWRQPLPTPSRVLFNVSAT